MDTPTWQNTLKTSNKKYGEIGRAANAAYDVGYEFFCWNERVYQAHFNKIIGKGVVIGDTGLTIKDLATVSIPKRIVVVAGRDKSGMPRLESYKVAYTRNQEEAGTHYDKAMDMAEADGLRQPFICYDEHEYGEILRIAERLNNSKK